MWKVFRSVLLLVFLTGAMLLSACDGETPAADGGTDGQVADSGPVASCEGAADGTPCTGGMICVQESCVVAGNCGDGYVDTARGEQCEDGNSVADDGCQPDDCTFTCEADGFCDDGFVCNGTESCTSGHVCAPGTAVADGTPCSTTAVPSGVCHPTPTPVCLAAECGNNVLDTGEQCDDGRNGDASDGCRDDCQFACTASGCTLTVMPAAHDFGMLAEGMTSGEQTFTIQNVSANPTGATLAVTLAGLNADNFTIVMNNCMIVLGPFLTCTVTVRFDPAGLGVRRAMLLVSGAAGEEGAAELRGFAMGANGRACTAGTECESGNCVDSFCCDESEATCNGCRSCGVSGSVGMCADVPAGENPHQVCTEPCAVGECDGAGACTPASSERVCNVQSCSNSSPSLQWDATTELVRECDGVSLTCPTSGALTARSCGRYTCDPTTSRCRTSCAVDQDCTTLSYCNAGSCVPKWSAPGNPCSSPWACLSHICTGDVCGSCTSNLGCAWAPTVCTTVAAGYNACVECNAGLGGTCGGGIGNTCDATSGVCRCSSSSECYDVANLCNANGFCACGSNPYGCGYPWQQCVGSGTSATCKVRTGYPCVHNQSCASGSCVGAVCQ